MPWLTLVSWIAIIIGLLQGFIITLDVIRHPQKMMPIMNIVWPLTVLYFPIFGLWAYYKLGRVKKQMDMENEDREHRKMGTPMEMHQGSKHTDTHDHHAMDHHYHHPHSERPFWQGVFISTTHCSSGCSLGDLIGAPVVFFLGITIAESDLFTDYAVEFVLAYLFGIAFQYYGMGFKTHTRPGKDLVNAIKADTLSLIAFEIGMFGWMAIVHYVLFTDVPRVNDATFWFMMQVAMMFGFCTSYPANWYLVKKGIKHSM
ncbi:hypothetical protein JOD43_000785 [Pullulanibacillus pueri]|uniref:Membrane protein n=1 Tax=Pullulanibacillus pueri TaxID=1437324 RepID=A0A8J2ZWW6_9BACL|nr:DUF4396 domain-containing protein [Pullulanibacillus pueri]MBM7680623.1 hypothetical protein [Pullulanibacillus pueri]GGH83908.1 membrane protein [Pullulanibacillus pueri]